MQMLSRKEELLLLTIWRLKKNAYGVTVRKHIAKATGTAWSIGAVYDVLDRLERKGFVSTTTSEPTAQRGGKRKRLYTITKEGGKALEEVKELNLIMWKNLPEMI